MTYNRVVAVAEDLERAILTTIRRHRVTHEEYRQATDLLVATVSQGEESLLFDVFFEAETTNVDNIGRTGSPAAIEGPFYIPGAPFLEAPYVMPHRLDERGEYLIFSGSVRTAEGDPIVGAELDMWHADADGQYSQIHPGIPDWNLRGRFVTDEDGAFEVRTILPPAYEIPKEGPTGRVLNALGRHFFRPAHLHVKVRAAGREELTSQLYFAGGEFLDDDVANAVRDGLIVTLRRRGDALETSYEFVLEGAQRAIPA
jgi:catechol 1,2-dioxygenase